MKIILILVLFSSLLLGNNLSVMLKVQNSNFKMNKEIISTIRSGAEDSLTSKNYMLISKQQQELALKEQAEQQKSDCYDDSCLVDTGKMMAAKMIYLIKITKVEDEYVFKGVLIDLETAATKKTVTKIYKYDINSISDLLNFSKNITNKVLSGEDKKIEIKDNKIIKLLIKSNNKNTKVYVDGNFIGKTPAQVKVLKGRHTIELKLDRYETIKITKEFYSDYDKSFTLINKYFLFDIKTEPKGASVFVNDKLIGTTPFNKELLKKDYKILLKLDDYKTVTINKDFVKNTKLNYKLKRKYITLSINTTPKDVSIFLNDKFISKTPFYKKIVSGKYNIRLMKAGYATKKINKKLFYKERYNFNYSLNISDKIIKGIKERELSTNILSPMMVYSFNTKKFMFGAEFQNVRWKYFQIKIIYAYGDTEQFGFGLGSFGIKFHPDKFKSHQINFNIALAVEFEMSNDIASVFPIELAYRYSFNRNIYLEIGVMSFYLNDIKDGKDKYGREIIKTVNFNRTNLFIRFGFLGTMQKNIWN